MNAIPTRLIIVFGLFLLAAGIAGGALPLFSRLKERGIHSALALATGMLIGTIFFHMLPEALDGSLSQLMVIVGLIGVFVVEKLIFNRGKGLESHAVIGITAFFGLSVHAVIVGFSLTAELQFPETRALLVTSLVIHKVSETFALGSVFLLAGYSKRKSLFLMALFSLLTPGAMALGSRVMGPVSPGGLSAVLGLAAGTFLYVALIDLLPEVFHHPKGRWLNLTLLTLGVAVIIAVTGV